MAGVAVPIIEAVAPSVISLIAGLVHKQAPIEQANNGPSTGPVKFANVFNAVVAALENAVSAGQLDKTAVPSTDTVKLIIQVIITALKLPGGVLSDVPAPTSVPTIAVSALASSGTSPMIFSVIGGTLQLQQATK